MKLLFVHEPKTDLKLIDFFIEQVQAVNEEDYGDCMREWNRDLLYLRDHLRKPTAWMRQKIDEMQGYIQFTPNWHVTSTHERILADAMALREHLLLNENAGRAA